MLFKTMKKFFAVIFLALCAVAGCLQGSYNGCKTAAEEIPAEEGCLVSQFRNGAQEEACYGQLDPVLAEKMIQPPQESATSTSYASK